MRWQKPGRFGHVVVKNVCSCARTTADSKHIIVETVSVSEQAMWEVFYCDICGGTGALRVSLHFNRLEIFHCTYAPTAIDWWMNQIKEPG